MERLLTPKEIEIARQPKAQFSANLAAILALDLVPKTPHF
jgi:hypothetical protein